jgi:hypothetical protein
MVVKTWSHKTSPAAGGGRILAKRDRTDARKDSDIAVAETRAGKAVTEKAAAVEFFLDIASKFDAQ